MKFPAPDYIRAIHPYVPGKPIEELEREYNISDPVKLASNENPLGPSPLALKAIASALTKLNRYPDGSGHHLVARLSEHLKINPERIVLGAGSDDLIAMLTRALLRTGDRVILPRPSFLMYEIMVRSVGAVPVEVPLRELSIDLEAVLERIDGATRMIFLCNPNNPTGTAFTNTELARFIRRVPAGVAVVVDEAYIEFVRDPESFSSLACGDLPGCLVTLRTFSKVYGLAGLRIGYGVMPPEIASLLHRIRQPFNAGSLAQAGAAAALADHEFFRKTVKLIHSGLDHLYSALEKRGIRYFPTHANFFLIDVDCDADAVFRAMLERGIIVRSMAAYGFPSYIRINVGLPEENARFLEALDRVLEKRCA